MINETEGPGTRTHERALDALPTRWSRSWAVAILASTVTVALVHLTGAPEILRAPITIWFLAICPGMAIVRLFRLNEPMAEITLAFALSLALVGLIPAIFLYAGAWSPTWSLTVLVAISATGLALDPVIVPKNGWASFARAVRGRILALAGQVDPVTGEPQSQTQLQESGNGVIARRQAPPTAIVTRLPMQARPIQARQQSQIRGHTLTSDAVVEDEPSAALRSALDQVIGDIADRRQSDE